MIKNGLRQKKSLKTSASIQLQPNAIFVNSQSLAAGLHREGSDAVNHYTHMDLKDRFMLMCYAYGQPVYYVDQNFNIVNK